MESHGFPWMLKMRIALIVAEPGGLGGSWGPGLGQAREPPLGISPAVFPHPPRPAQAHIVKFKNKIKLKKKNTLGNIPKSELQVACGVREILGWEESEAE